MVGASCVLMCEGGRNWGGEAWLGKYCGDATRGRDEHQGSIQRTNEGFEGVDMCVMGTISSPLLIAVRIFGSSSNRIPTSF
eukprot:6191485-Pleurochrysis_carterae.AAC.3